MDGIGLPQKAGDSITVDHKILNVENDSRCGHRHALIVQNDVHELDSEISDENERNFEDNVVFTKEFFFLHRSPK